MTLVIVKSTARIYPRGRDPAATEAVNASSGVPRQINRGERPNGITLNNRR